MDMAHGCRLSHWLKMVIKAAGKTHSFTLFLYPLLFFSGCNLAGWYVCVWLCVGVYFRCCFFVQYSFLCSVLRCGVVHNVVLNERRWVGGGESVVMWEVWIYLVSKLGECGWTRKSGGILVLTLGSFGEFGWAWMSVRDVWMCFI